MFKRWQFWIILVFVLLFTWGLARKARADVEVGLSFGVIEAPEMISQRIGYAGENTRIRYERHGGPGYNESNSLTIAWVVSWREGRKIEPYMQFGVTYFDEKIIDPDDKFKRPLVDENLTYSLGFGVRLWQVLELGLDHNSVAGRAERNNGVDRIYLAWILPLR